MLLTLLLVAAQVAPSPSGASDTFNFEYYRVKERLEADGSLRRTLEVSVLVRAPSAVAQFGQLGLPYVKDYGDVQFNQVRVHKPDGTSRSVTDGVLEDLNPFGINDASIPIDVRFKKLTIPRLEPGDRLSYSVVLTQKPFVPGDLSGEMKFFPLPMDGPQTYELDLPAQSRIRVELRPGLGATWETVPSAQDRLVRRLSISVPPEVLKAGARSEEQVRALQTPDVAYSTFSSWADVGSWWWRMSQGQVLSDGAVRAEAARLTAGKASPRERVEALAAFVGATVRYLNVSFGMGRMQPRAAGSVLASRFGDCKDKVGLLMALADAVGIEVRPVLISASRFDLFDTVPGPHQFDHVIAVAKVGASEKDWMWIDATTALTPLALLQPTRDKRALLIERDGRGVIVKTPAVPDVPRAIAVDLKSVLDGAGVMKGRVRLTTRSDYEKVLRDSFGGASSEQYPEVVKAILARTWKDARVKGVQIADLSDLANPFWFEFEFERDISGLDSTKEWKLWIPDMGPSIVEPDDDVTATKPLQFVASEVALTASVELPEGVTARAPLSVALDRPFASVSSKYSVEGRTLKVNRLIRFPQPFLSPDQLAAYQALKKSADTDREQEFIVGPVAAAALSAASLQKEGKAASEKKEWKKGIDLLERAAAADPKLKDVYLDLGLAHRGAEQDAQAIAAFSHAIGADPFHDRAYAERAYSLFDMDKDDEAEKDLLKQIEVAPFKEWSYSRLARLRVSQDRYAEAIEYWTKSLAIDGADVDTWIALGWAYARTGAAADARKTWDKAEGLGPKDGMKIGTALGFAEIRDQVSAARLAKADLAAVQKNVDGITKTNYQSSFIYWSRRLSEAWLLIGDAALEAGDLPTAERYLKAAWESGLLSNAGYSLGLVRQKQGRSAQATSIWNAVREFRTWSYRGQEFQKILDNPQTRRADTVVERKAPSGTSVVVVGDTAEVARLRILVAPGPNSEKLREPVLVLIEGGKVTAIKSTAEPPNAAAIPLLQRFIGVAAAVSTPEGPGGKVLREGQMACQRGAPCSVLFNIVGDRPTYPSVGTIDIESIEPAKGAQLKPGAQVVLKARIRYELMGAEPGHVTMLIAGDGERSTLLVPAMMRPVKPGKGVVDFDVSFLVPAKAREVSIGFPLTLGGSRPSSTFVGLVYKVSQ